MKKNQNIQGIVSKKGNVKVKNFSLEDNKITSDESAENTQGVVAEIDVEVTGDVSIGRNEIIIQQKVQELATETEKQITETLTEQEISPQEQKVINQTILFLGTKELFINYRQASINNLIDCYNKLEKSTGKLNRFTTASNIMGITGKLANIIPGGGVAEAPLGILGDTINLAGTIVKGKTLDKFTKAFQEILVKDKNNLSLFDGNYMSLTNAIWSDKEISEKSEVIATIIKTLNLVKTNLDPFSDDYDVFSQSVSGIWQGRSSLELGEIKTSVESIMNNLNEFKKNFQQEKEQLSQQTWFITIKEQTDLLEEKQQAQVEIPPKGNN